MKKFCIVTLFLLAPTLHAAFPWLPTVEELLNRPMSAPVLSCHVESLLKKLEVGIQRGYIKLAIDEQIMNSVCDFCDHHGAAIRQKMISLIAYHLNELHKKGRTPHSVDDAALNTYLNSVGANISKTRKELMPFFVRTLKHLETEIKAGRLHLNMHENNIGALISIMRILFGVMKEKPAPEPLPMTPVKKDSPAVDALTSLLIETMPAPLRALFKLMQYKPFHALLHKGDSCTR